MAKKAKGFEPRRSVKKKTSIGKSHRSRPTNKHKRRRWKKDRGQGKPL